MSKDHGAPPVKLLGVDISAWPRPFQFAVLCKAVFAFYLVHGYLQELLFRLPGMRPFGWYLTLCQFLIYSALSSAEMRLTSGRIARRRIPWNTYFQVAFYTVATLGLSNASLGYLNYPTQIVFKCCKLIPVLVGGILIQGKRYGPLDVLAACVMSAGLVLFSLADNSVAPNFEPSGYAMICAALVADAVIGNVQEKAMRRYNAPNDEVVLYSYSIGSGYIFVGTLLTGQLFEAFAHFAERPLQTYGYTLLFGAFGYLGVNVVLTLVRLFGALVAVTVTTMRKAVTIVCSFYFFAKPFTMGYVWGGLVVLAAIYLNVYANNKRRIDAKLAEWMRPIGGRSRMETEGGKTLLEVLLRIRTLHLKSMIR